MSPGQCTEPGCGRFSEHAGPVLVTLVSRPYATSTGDGYGETVMCPECGHAYITDPRLSREHRARIRASATGETVAEARAAIERARASEGAPS